MITIVSSNWNGRKSKLFFVEIKEESEKFWKQLIKSFPPGTCNGE